MIGAFVPLATYALFHMVTVFPLSWVFLDRPTSTVPGFLAIEIGTALSASRRSSARARWPTGSAGGGCCSSARSAIAIFALVAPLLLDGGQVGEFVFMVIGFALLGLSFGQSSGRRRLAFTASYRYTGSALTSDLAWLFGAGFAPLVALVLATRFGLASSGAYLLSGAICTVIALLLSHRLELPND